MADTGRTKRWTRRAAMVGGGLAVVGGAAVLASRKSDHGGAHDAYFLALTAALRKAGMSIQDIDAYEVNEAFAPVPLAWLQVLGADPARLNANGGAIALGHPVGCSGAFIATKALYELQRIGGRYALVTMCIGGGQGIAAIFERL